MEGDGPTMGSLVKMDLIIAGTNPLATDMVAANIMGFNTNEIPTLVWAIKSGMRPTDVSEIEIRGERIENVKRKFVKPNVVPWTDINGFWDKIPYNFLPISESFLSLLLYLSFFL